MKKTPVKATTSKLRATPKLRSYTQKKKKKSRATSCEIEGLVDTHLCKLRVMLQISIVLREIIVNRTYVTYKHLYIYVFLLTIFGPIYYYGGP